MFDATVHIRMKNNLVSKYFVRVYFLLISLAKKCHLKGTTLSQKCTNSGPHSAQMFDLAGMALLFCDFHIDSYIFADREIVYYYCRK